jgi:hypothetical protein
VDDAAEQLTEQLGKPVSPLKRYTRVYLAWQVRGRIRNFILAHQNLLHPEIRRSAWITVNFRLLLIYTICHATHFYDVCMIFRKQIECLLQGFESSFKALYDFCMTFKGLMDGNAKAGKSTEAHRFKN